MNQNNITNVKMDNEDIKKMLSHILSRQNCEWFCRLCFAKINGGVLLADLVTSKGDNPTSFADILHDLSGISFHDEDELPIHLCSECSEATLSVYKLKNLCKNYATKWIKILNSLEKLHQEPIKKNTKSVLILFENEKIGIAQDDAEIDKNNTKNSLERLQYYCYKCNKCLGTPGRFKRHMEIFHSGRPNFNCPVCRHRLASKTSLEQHLDKYCLQMEHKVSPPNECHLCDKKFWKSNNLSRHLKTHSLEVTRRIVCQSCGKMFAKGSVLTRHLKTCKGFMTPEELAKNKQLVVQKILEHRNRSDMELQYECHDCGYKFYSKKNLSRHIRHIHLRQYKIHTCPKCNKPYTSGSRLKRHMVVHTRERPYECTLCQKRFVSKAGLVNHTRLHTGERPFPCDLCPERFLNASRRAAHRRIAHTGRQEFCSVCSHLFHTPYALKKHMRKHLDPNSRLYMNIFQKSCP